MVNLLDTIKGLVTNPVATGVAGIAVGTAVGVGATLAVSSSRKRKRKSKSSSKSRRKKGSKRNKRKYYPEPRGKKYSRRKIRTTKTGQPYIILASGKARFIKKSSARASRRRKGGRY